MRIDFCDAFPADLLLRHLQHTGTIAGFGLIAMDGKIFVYDVEDAVKVRTGARGYDALQGTDD